MPYFFLVRPKVLKLVLWVQPVADASAVVETRTVVPSDPIPERAIP